MPRSGDPRHRERRQLMRIVGPAILGIGAVFLVIGIGNFFYSFGSFGPPRYFWCAFVGMPLIFIGSVITKFAYMGSIARYMAEEVTPVGIDVTNSVVDGTKNAMRTMSSALASGVREGLSGESTEQTLYCRQCGKENEPSSRFCSACGAALETSIICPQCGETCEPDDRFCDQCGTSLTQQS